MANLNDGTKPHKLQTTRIKHNVALTPAGRKLQGVALWNGK